MIVNEEKKTSPKQRIIIVLIAILMLGSTFALASVSRRWCENGWRLNY